ncbi:MAG: exodeoxyribonuclease V subunit beta [Proteobacteria bacterium]|nr:exodeoxyribonuclease V subunit beta [Pseudomonadota bacterium]MBU1709908.1 exodeoxyribonuclease V subunit beta [Pseudomonadota bacterium]
MKHFDIWATPLDGIRLIDASAGTGKTYTIAALVLRLLLEKRLRISEILVVTYTEAATEDLKARIREKIRDAQRVFQGGETDEAFLRDLSGRQEDMDAGLEVLAEALRDYDEASIFTIHGFCQRMLMDNALEACTFFDSELLSDTRGLLEEIAGDFFREHFYQAGILFVEYGRKFFNTATVLKYIGQSHSRPDLEIIPAFAEVDPHEITLAEQEFSQLFSAAVESWHQARDHIYSILMNDPGLSLSKYKKSNIEPWLAAMDGMLTMPTPTVDFFDKFEKFTTGHIEASVKKGHVPPVHPFFDVCENLGQARSRLLDLYDKRVKHLRRKVIEFIRRELLVRKRQESLYSFDDLLSELSRALAGPSGKSIADNIRKKFPAAMIDEFQDTDPVQYEIFRNIYGAEGLLYLIGDPKQAIYSFRGADIFTYMEASQKAGSRATLVTNWRSVPELITAVNTIFTRPQTPFAFSAIIASAVRPPVEVRQAKLLIDGRDESPFQLWIVRREQDPENKSTKLIAKERARKRILNAVVHEIIRLLTLGHEQRAMIGNTPLKASDIAVLVRTNSEACLTQQALAGCGVVSVLHSNASVFLSPEAGEMQRLLLAVADPGNERKLKSALVTDALGLKGADLDEIDENRWLDRIASFRGYHDQWLRNGFIGMFRAFMAKESVRSRLIACKDGERRLTNMLHLAEILHKQETERHLGMAGLLKFLNEKINSPQADEEEYQLRLESDRDCVRIVTIHKAKGLEYPVVFCPFSWGGVRSGKPGTDKPVVFHDPQNSNALIMDIGSENIEQHKELALLEEISEDIRLLYVALTRASCRCYMVWGALSGGEYSAPAYLFHQVKAATPSRMMEDTANRFKSLADEELIADIAALEQASGNTVVSTRLPSGKPGQLSLIQPHETRLEFKAFDGVISRNFRIASFSSLVQEHGGADILDYDSIHKASRDSETTPGAVAPESAAIFSFPQGAGPGTFMHDLLEHYDFTCEDRQVLRKLVRDKLQLHGYAVSWEEAIVAMVDNVIMTPLLADDPECRLSQVSGPARLNEMEFYFPQVSVSAGAIKAIINRGGKRSSGVEDNQVSHGFGAKTLEGFMKGFVDLVFQRNGRFYIVDWKSNHLGNRVEDYSQDRLRKIIRDRSYDLQYHIYTVALHRYLGSRLADYEYLKHFGGVFYIFLRGVDKSRGPGFGIFHDRPEQELVLELSNIFAGHCRQ